MGQKNILTNKKSNRIILFADLRDSTNILLNFEKGLYPGNENNLDTDFTYENFLRDIHESAYKELYLSTLKRDFIFALIKIFLLICLSLLQSGNVWAQESYATDVKKKQISGDKSYSKFNILPGEHKCRVDGKRKYLLYIPAKYNASRPAPLVLFFHGGGGHMEQAASDYGWGEKADQEGFVLAFPNGASRLPRQHLATWNAGECCGYARDKNIDDTGFVKLVITDIKRQVNVDESRIFATGMSNGGMMAHRLACEMPDTFRAVASVAGTDNTKTCNPTRPISVLHIHALDDTHALFNGGAGKDAFKDESKVTDFTSVAETIKRWIIRDNAEKDPERVLDLPDVYADLYTSRYNSAQVELVVTEKGGHSWPGGKAVRGKTPSQAINATDFIWDFFMKQTRL